MQDTYPVRLTAAQIRLLRKLVCDKALEVKLRPLPEDGDLAAKLEELDRVLYPTWQIMAP